MTTISKLSALACHQGTPENEWKAAAIAFFRLHRKAGTSPAEHPGRLDVSAFVSSANAFWQNRAPATRKPSGPIWSPTAADGNTKYPGLDIAEIVRRDPAYGIQLVEANSRRDAASRKGKRK